MKKRLIEDTYNYKVEINNNTEYFYKLNRAIYYMIKNIKSNNTEIYLTSNPNKGYLESVYFKYNTSNNKEEILKELKSYITNNDTAIIKEMNKIFIKLNKKENK